jgi:hypothetical protein
MRTIEFPTRSWKRGIAVLGALAGLALAPAPAQADVCGDFEDIAEDLLDIYFDEFEEFFTLSEKTCDAMANTFHAACTSAVKDAEKCWNRQFLSVSKAAKPGCTEVAKNPSACNQEYKDLVEGAKDELEWAVGRIREAFAS